MIYYTDLCIIRFIIPLDRLLLYVLPFYVLLTRTFLKSCERVSFLFSRWLGGWETVESWKSDDGGSVCVWRGGKGISLVTILNFVCVVLLYELKDKSKGHDQKKRARTFCSKDYVVNVNCCCMDGLMMMFICVVVYMNF